MVDMKEVWVLIKTINLKVLGGGGGGVDWEEGSVEVGQTRAAMRL